MTLYIGDVRDGLRSFAGMRAQTCVTSPPYWGLRDYGTAQWVGGDAECDHVAMEVGMSAKNTLGPSGNLPPTNAANVGRVQQFRETCGHCGARRVDQQLGLEPTIAEYVANMVDVFRLVRDVLADDGTLWLNLGDSYAGNAAAGDKTFGNPAFNENRPSRAATKTAQKSVPDGLKPKDLCGIPWRVAFALQADGWYLRSDIIWCLSGGASVYARTQKGDMPVMVKDLVRLRPDTVQLWNGSKWTQALGWSRSLDTGGALEIELRSGERIGVTLGHQWPTARGLVRTDKLRVGDVIDTTTLPEPDAPTQAAALDDDVAWFCGLYLAEGSVSGDTVQIAGNAKETDERLRRIERVASAFHGSLFAYTNGNSASIHVNGPVIAAVARAYVHGGNAHDKGIKVRAWQRSNAWLRCLLEGYLAGDGHYDEQNDRWRLGFCRNDRLADDFRTLAARLGLSLRLNATTATGFGREWPAYRGDIRLTPTTHHNRRVDSEIVAMRASRARQFWDIGVEDEPHTFALASGVLTHNSKPNPMPESVTDRPTKAHEYLFLLAKSERYYYDAAAIAEPAMSADRPQPKPEDKTISPNATAWLDNRYAPGASGYGVGADGTRNRRTVWTIPTSLYADAHFAVFPEALVEPCIMAGSRVGDVILDSFMGSGTVARVAQRLGRKWAGCELNPAYAAMVETRTKQSAFALGAA